MRWERAAETGARWQTAVGCRRSVAAARGDEEEIGHQRGRDAGQDWSTGSAAGCWTKVAGGRRAAKASAASGVQTLGGPRVSGDHLTTAAGGHQTAVGGARVSCDHLTTAAGGHQTAVGGARVSGDYRTTAAGGHQTAVGVTGPALAGGVAGETGFQWIFLGWPCATFAIVHVMSEGSIQLGAAGCLYVGVGVHWNNKITLPWVRCRILYIYIRVCHMERFSLKF